mmetsp:Transcript_28825/g.94189  ORF Transcript_28825/g.94189 Transcript_28825/m.94189 type:complete len:220 (+) Transcript_28825:780-1439(+)
MVLEELLHHCRPRPRRRERGGARRFGTRHSLARRERRGPRRRRRFHGRRGCRCGFDSRSSREGGCARAAPAGAWRLLRLRLCEPRPSGTAVRARGAAPAGAATARVALAARAAPAAPIPARSPAPVPAGRAHAPTPRRGRRVPLTLLLEQPLLPARVVLVAHQLREMPLRLELARARLPKNGKDVHRVLLRGRLFHARTTAATNIGSSSSSGRRGRRRP